MSSSGSNHPGLPEIKINQKNQLYIILTIDEDVVPTATAPPNKVQSVASERVVTMAPSAHIMATKTEGPPSVGDATDVLPTEAPYVTTPLPQGISSSNIATEIPGGKCDIIKG